MRLINTSTFKLENFLTRETPPPYTILSHTWEQQEILYQDIVTNDYDPLQKRPEFAKLREFVALSRANGIAYAWVDTCCIDKSSSAELVEAINSMYKWYHGAAACYVYLVDVSVKASPTVLQRQAHATRELTKDSGGQSLKGSFAQSRWFTRGWTLQELIAPQDVIFYGREWSKLGTKGSRANEIHAITGIATEALKGSPMRQFSVKDRLSWAAHRRTTREEDGAYSLLGLFDVYMPTLYGEGMERAFLRLSEEISRNESTTLKLSHRFEVFDLLEIKRNMSVSQHNKLHSLGILTYPAPVFVDKKWTYPFARILGNRFRLLTLEQGRTGEMLTGSLHEFDLSTAPPYYALSYAWGNETDLHPISINQRQRLIRSSLFNALQRIRLKFGTFSIWIDSICINQADPVERSSQVTKMARIYKNAEAVLIWLGEEDSTSKLAIAHIQTV